MYISAPTTNNQHVGTDPVSVRKTHCKHTVLIVIIDNVILIEKYRYVCGNADRHGGCPYNVELICIDKCCVCTKTIL